MLFDLGRLRPSQHGRRLGLATGNVEGLCGPMSSKFVGPYRSSRLDEAVGGGLFPLLAEQLDRAWEER